jgi:hypothetical protein
MLAHMTWHMRIWKPKRKNVVIKVGECCLAKKTKRKILLARSEKV